MGYRSDLSKTTIFTKVLVWVVIERFSPIKASQNAFSKRTSRFGGIQMSFERCFVAPKTIIEWLYVVNRSVAPTGAFLTEQYGTEVSPEFISSVTDAVMAEVTDGPKGMPEALATVLPATTLQTCIAHLIRNSLDFASWKDRKALAAVIKPIYTAVSVEAAEAELDAFEAGPWGRSSPPSWAPGAGPGTGSFPSLPSRRRSAG